LEFLNGKSTKEDEVHIVDIDEKDIEHITIDKDELEKFNVIEFDLENLPKSFRETQATIQR
jgi:predicted methyltransferase